MSKLTRKQQKMVINILKTSLKYWRSNIKKMKNDKQCDLETYEELVDKCKEVSIIVIKMEELL